MSMIAITGASGAVGTVLRPELLGLGYSLKLLDRVAPASVSLNETFRKTDILDRSDLAEALAGCDAVLHLASCTTDDVDWNAHVSLSIEGAINLFEACREAGVGRVIYASSHHVVGLYPRRPPVGVDIVPRPDSRYAAGKAFGETLASLYAFKFGMSVLAIRIGNADALPQDRRRLGNWVSMPDLAQLVDIGVKTPDLLFEIVYGVSDTTGDTYDNSNAYRLGYKPTGRPMSYAKEVQEADPPPVPGSPQALSPAEMTVGGQFSQREFVGNPQRLLARGAA
ncbi:NAD(P)-dependent oxidoreductase [Rhizobium pusense]|uniref:NAD-dependent epimerase/dehydratase family protein n=1 Tax=Agrobacterium pusense TaxID=648995 RepID=UPI001FCCE792|nr:NAD(P)-dependent oxidoreductase [Agrobacterium pusense]MCJ2877636.1 NAD(P)-dependent oxidoreductase [Agrobacterium pusense]